MVSNDQYYCSKCGSDPVSASWMEQEWLNRNEALPHQCHWAALFSILMFPTLVRLSKASRRPLTSKRANKDFYKGPRRSSSHCAYHFTPTYYRHSPSISSGWTSYGCSRKTCSPGQSQISSYRWESARFRRTVNKGTQLDSRECIVCSNNSNQV